MNRLLAILIASLFMAGCGGGSGGDSPLNSAKAQAVAPQTSFPIGGSGIILDTGPFPCNGATVTASWANPSPSPIKVVMARQWVGLDYTLESDTQAMSLVLDSAGTAIGLLVIQQLDNYKHRSFEQERWVSYAPNYIEIPVGGSIQLQTFCNRIFGGANAHVMLAIWRI